VPTDEIAELVQRSGDLKGELVDFAWQSRWSKHLMKALQREFGHTIVADEEQLTNFIDRFVLQHRLPDGRTVVEHFVAKRSELPVGEREMLLGWRDVVEGLFEIERRDGEALVAVNLIDELTYRVHSNMGRAGLAQFPRKGFLIARIVPVADAWVLSGAQAALPRSARAEALRIAAEQAMKHPELRFRNPEHLARAWELQRWERERFVEFFGSDLVVVPGGQLRQRLAAFWDWRLQQTTDGLPRRDARQRGLAPLGADELADLPEDLTGAADVAVIYDEDEGLTYLADFGLVEAAFDNPALASQRAHRQAVLGYLKDDSVSTLPFRRLAERDTDKASQLFQRLLKKPSFSWGRDGDALLRTHKARHCEREPCPSILPLSDTLARSLPTARQPAAS
jgi:hypothetical protein